MTRNLRHGLAMLAALALIFTGVFVIASQGAYATTTPAVCPNLVGWAPNADELADRSPTSTPEGLEFSNTDLTHHAANLDVADLEPGSYVAHPAPDQSSFFSVEVYTPDVADHGYATLRWDTGSSKWTMVVGGDIYTNADPAALVDMVTPHKSHHVVSFGVGYTQHPAGLVTTVVSSVTFNGKTYDLTCQPKTETSSPAPHSSSTSPAPHSSSTSAKPHTSSSAAAAGTGPSLPVTGPPVGLIVGGAVSLLILGGAAWFVGRRRKTTFQA